MTPQQALTECTCIGNADGVKAALAALAADVAVHAKDDEALRWAVFYGQTDVVRILLATGADPVVVLKNAIGGDRNKVATTLDGCVDVLNQEQRAALLAPSPPNEFIQLRAINISAEKRRAARRRTTGIDRHMHPLNWTFSAVAAGIIT